MHTATRTKTGIVIDTIMKAAIVLFASVSIFLTQDGLSLVWSQNETTHIIARWVLAVAIGLFQVCLAFLMANRDRDISVVKLLIAFCLIAALSLFFNFNSIYSKIASSKIEGDVIERYEYILKANGEQSKRFLKDYYKLNELELKVKNSLTDVSQEKVDPNKPGEGSIWHEKNTIYLKNENELRVAKMNYDGVVKQIDTILNVNDSPGQKTDDYNEKRRLSKVMMKKVKDFNGLMTTYNYKTELNLQKMIDDFVDKTSLEYSLFTIFDVASKALKDQADTFFLLRVLIAILLSLSVDVPIFAAVLVIRSTNGQSGQSSTERFTEHKW